MANNVWIQNAFLAEGAMVCVEKWKTKAINSNFHVSPFPETTGKTLYFTLDINWLLHNSSTQSELKHFEHFGKKTKKTDW